MAKSLQTLTFCNQLTLERCMNYADQILEITYLCEENGGTLDKNAAMNIQQIAAILSTELQVQSRRGQSERKTALDRSAIPSSNITIFPGT